MSGFPLGFSSPGGRPGACLPGEHIPGEMSRRWEGGEGRRGSAWGSRERNRKGGGKDKALPSQVAQGSRAAFSTFLILPVFVWLQLT